MKSALSWVASRVTFLIASPGVVRSSYSISSILRWPSLSFRPPRALTVSTQSLTLGQWVIEAPTASGPVLGAEAPIFTVFCACATPIDSAPANSPASAAVT